MNKKLMHLSANWNSEKSEATYFVFTKNENSKVHFMNISDDMSKNLKENIEKNIKKSIKDFTNEDNIVSDFWHSKLQKNGLYILDIDQNKNEMPEIIKNIQDQIFDVPDTYKDNDFKNIRCIVTALKSGTDNQRENILCFKLVYPLSRVAHRNRLSFFTDGTLLDEVKRPEFVYRDDFDFFIYDNSIYITDIDKFISFCSLNEPHAQQADKVFENIKTSFPFLQFDKKKFNTIKMHERFNKLSYAKKVIEVEDSINKNFKNISLSQLKTGISKVNIYSKKFEIENNNLIINTYEKFDILLKLFNDEILISEITNIMYDAKNKNKIN